MNHCRITTMSGSWRLLCWLAAGFVLCSQEVSAGSFSLSAGPCVPPPEKSAPVGLHGYRRYFANDSLIGRPVPCTRDDKICFRHNLVFHPQRDRCEPLGTACPRGISYSRITELENGSGRVVGSCPEYDDPCSGYRMAYDGICYRKETVRDVICGCDAKLTPHFLGDKECRKEPITPVSVNQPDDDGSCVIPDLRYPDARRSMLLSNATIQSGYSRLFKCGSDQATCFSTGKVFVNGHEGCHTLLEQGPCAEEHVVALDVQAATEGRAEGTCVHVRGGCPPGHKLMLFDNQCHEDREIAILAPGRIILDEHGRHTVTDCCCCWGNVLYPTLLDNQCGIRLGPSSFYPAAVANPAFPPCGSDNMNGCKRYEVVNDFPKPDLNDRK